MEQLQILSGEPDLSILDGVPWAELDHAYGAAIDVPNQIQSLVSPDAAVRRGTIWGFYGNLFHQGSVYPATVAAIPIFQHLLRYEQVAERPRILELLANFAVGGPLENVDLTKFIGGTSANSDSTEDAVARECYLGVGAGAPLYELLLGDRDPRVVISAAFSLAFFPAHAFASCRHLLAIARDDSQHAYVRSSALIACSYLNGGAVRDDFLRLLSALVEHERADEEMTMPFLAAIAVYCLVREKRNLQDERFRSRSDGLAIRCVQRGIQLPECSFYRAKANAAEDVSKVDYMEIMMPDPQFPWGDMTKRIRQHTNSLTQDEVAMQSDSDEAEPEEADDPDPVSFDVKQGVFDRDNVIAAVRRFRARFRGNQWGGPVAIKEFEPFKPYVMLAWDEVLRLLDSDVDEDRWAAAGMIEHFGPLDEPAVDQLIDRLLRGDNCSLDSAIKAMQISERQCEMLCDQFCNRKSSSSEGCTPRDGALAIVLKHGSVDQVRRMFDECELEWKATAAHELCRREKLDHSEALPVFAEALLSSDYGSRMSATWLFANWSTAQRWFLESYESVPETQRWAIAEAMSTFGADLSEQQEALFARIVAEKKPVLAAKLIRLTAHFETPQPTTLEHLLGLIDDNSPPILRLAIVDTLGSWTVKNLDGAVGEHLATFATDASSRVRRAAIDHLAKFSDSSKWNIGILRSALADEDPENRRHAMWHLSRQGELTAEDARQLLSPDQPDRLAAETFLAAATNRNILALLDESTIDLSQNERPLARSVWEWASRMPPADRRA